jgi:hypothetical protein
MPTFTIEQDKAVRTHLAALAKSVRAKFSATAYQGDYENTVTGDTFGDRLQVGTQRTISGVRYLFVLNMQIDRNSGGKVAVCVTAWSLSGNTGQPVGTWPVRKTYIGADKKRKSDGMYLTPNGFVRRIGRNDVLRTSDEMTKRIELFLNQASERIKASLTSNEVSPGRPVQIEHGYGPDHPKYGETYDTGESHLLVFGGYHAAGARLAR